MRKPPPRPSPPVRLPLQRGHALRRPLQRGYALRRFLGLPLALLPAGCIIVVGDRHGWSPDTLVGSGVRETRHLDVESFTGVEVAGGIDLDVRVGSATEVRISGDDNLLPYVRTEVEDGVLRIELEDGSYRPDEDLQATVSTTQLE